MPITFNRPRRQVMTQSPRIKICLNKRARIMAPLCLPLIAVSALMLIPLIPDLAQAQDSNRQKSLPRQMQVCQQIAQDAARLACFDRINLDEFRKKTSDRSQTFDQRPASPEDDTPINKAESQSQSESGGGEDRFGFAPRPEPGQSDEERSMTVESAEQTLRGRWIIRMKNGQIWQQVDGARLSKIKGGLKADIEKGVMSNFIMTIDGRSFRVKRLQ